MPGSAGLCFQRHAPERRPERWPERWPERRRQAKWAFKHHVTPVSSSIYLHPQCYTIFVAGISAITPHGWFIVL